MKKVFKSLKSLVLVGFLIAGILVLSSCNKYGQKIIKTKKWVNWEIAFKKNTSEEEKAKALIAIDKNILKYLDSAGVKIVSIKFSHVPIDIRDLNKSSSSYMVRVDLTSSQGTPTPHIVGGPRHDPFIFLSNNIENIIPFNQETIINENIHK